MRSSSYVVDPGCSRLLAGKLDPQVHSSWRARWNLERNDHALQLAISNHNFLVT